MDRRTLQLLRSLGYISLAASASAEAALAQAPAGPTQPVWHFHHENVLGTSLDLSLRAPTEADAARVEAAVLAGFDRHDQILSAWRKDSELSRWLRTSMEPVAVSPDLLDVLARFDSWRERTSGALDPSAEAAAQLWQRASSEGRRPTRAEIALTLEAIQQPHWSLDREHGTATRLSSTPLALASFTKSYIASNVADEALKAGAAGIMLNVGGDIVVRGNLAQVVDIVDPQTDAEGERPLDRIVVRDRAVATSGSYRRGFDLAADIAVNAQQAPQFSHILDPRTAEPAGHVLSSTVIARDASTAGALATAFSVLPVSESRQLAAASGVEYLIVTREGGHITSAGWSRYQAPGLRPAAYHAPFAPTPPANTAAWNQQFELSVGLELARIDDPRYRRPYVAVWVEDADHFPVRTLALWLQNPRWLPDLKQWYRDDQIRNLSEGTDISKTVASATRPPGKYTVKWDGKDNEGKLVKPGKYTVCIEASREHGTYQVLRQEMDFSGKPQQMTLPGGKELGAATLAYRKR